MAAKSRSAKFYASNPEARRKKAQYDAKFNRKPSQVKKRVALNKYNRKKGTYGNGDGLDASHKGRRIIGFSSQSRNRGDKNNSPGDRRARGRR
jgi:hypothetical protein